MPPTDNRQRAASKAKAHVAGQCTLGCRRFGEPEVHDPRLVVAVEHDVGQPQVAVRDARAVEHPRLFPQRRQDPVAQAARFDGVESRGGDALLGQQGGPVLERGDCDDIRCSDTGPGGQQAGEGLDLELALRRGGHRLVVEFAIQHPAVRLERHIGIALVDARCLDGERRPVPGARQQRGGAPGINDGRPDVGHLDQAGLVWNAGVREADGPARPPRRGAQG